MIRRTVLTLAFAIACAGSFATDASAQDQAPEDALKGSSGDAAVAAEAAESGEMTVQTADSPEVIAAAASALSPPETADPAILDLIQFGPGEILRGDIDRIHDGDLHFDSDEMDEVKLDIDDIDRMVSNRVHTYRFVGRRIYAGTAVMDAEKIAIRTSQGVVVFPRAELVGMVSGSPKEWNFWSGEATIGLTVRAGNTQQTDLALFARLTRQTSLTRFNNQYTGSLASDSTGTTANSHRMTNAFDVYLTRRFFITLMSFELFADEFLNIDMRLTPAMLLGYDVMANKWVTWEIGAGLGYQYTRAIQSTTGSLGRSDAAVLVTTGIDVDITSDIEWDTDYKLNITPTNTDLTSQNITSVLEFDIIGPIDIEATFNFDRIRLPPETSPGVRPESNDYRLTLGFGADF